MEPEPRKARNEAHFRLINEQIENVADDVFDGDGEAPQVWEFVCECARRDCAERVPLTLREYEAIRADGRRFFVLPGHADPTIERVVDRTARYWVVEKLGPEGAVAEREDPRG